MANVRAHILINFRPLTVDEETLSRLYKEIRRTVIYHTGQKNITSAEYVEEPGFNNGRVQY